MDEKKEQILSILTKLMTLAKDQASKPEGELAMKMASKIMAKLMIEESEIDLSDKSADNIFEDEDGWEGLTDQGGERQWVSDLALHLSNSFSTHYWINSVRGTVHFIGTESNLETCLYLMDSIYSHIERGARKTLPEPDEWRNRNVFGQSAAEVVGILLHDMKRRIEAQMRKNYSGGYDLILVKDSQIRQVATDLFKQRGFSTSSRDGIRRSTR